MIDNSMLNDFLSELEEVGYEVSTENLTSIETQRINSIWKNVINFLQDNKLVLGQEDIVDVNNPTNVLNSNITINDIGSTEIISLVEACKVPADYKIAAAKAVAHCIEKYKSSNMVAEHFSNKKGSHDKAKFDGDILDLNNIYSTEMIESGYYSDPSMALEAFGVSSNNTILDAKIAIAVTIMKFHKGILTRLLPNIPTNSNVVIYDVDRYELYDFNQAGAATAAERYDGAHRIPFIELHGNPSPANTSAKEIIVKEANDTSADLVMQDGYLHLNKQANMFDLAKDAGVPGYEHIDYTDLVGEGVKLSSIVYNLVYDDGATTQYNELVELVVADRQGSRFVMTANSADASDRVCNLEFVEVEDNATIKMDVTASQALALLDANHTVSLNFTVNGKVNLKTSYINVLASLNATLITKDGTTVLPAQETIFNNMTITPFAYKIAATYNEENLRKTSSSMRIMNKTIGYEIPGTKNVSITHSLIQPKPDSLISGISDLMRIGNDDRGVKLIIDAMDNVFTRVQQEAMSEVPYDKRVMNEFVAGNKVLPYVFKDTVNVSPDVMAMRSAERLSDVRGLVEEKLLHILTLLYNKSYYLQALPPGTRPVFKVLTSGYLKDVVLDVPYYTTIVDQTPAEKAGDEVIEYRRILSNGTELQIISSNFEYLADKMLIVPVIPSMPQSELNFGHNWDRGSFVVSITAFMNRSGFKEIIANSREFPIVTNPVGAFVEFANLSDVFTAANVGSL